jgi:hypothetical protein
MTEYSVCTVHDIIEIITRDAFHTCLHCGHVYLSAADLVEAHNEDEADYCETMNQEPSFLSLSQVDAIDSCPYCGHGWR